MFVVFLGICHSFVEFLLVANIRNSLQISLSAEWNLLEDIEVVTPKIKEKAK